MEVLGGVSCPGKMQKPKNKTKQNPHRPLTLLILLLSLTKGIPTPVEASASSSSSDSQLHCLAKNVFHEARGEGRHGMMMVGHVVLNRVKSKKFSDTICGVIYQPKQFSWVHKKKKHSVNPDSKEWKQALDVARTVLERDNDPTGGSLYFYSSSILKKKPSWAKKKQMVAKSGNHVFFR